MGVAKSSCNLLRGPSALPALRTAHSKAGLRPGACVPGNVSVPGQSHLEDGNPGVANVVEVDGSLEGVVLPGGAVGVVLVPVHTGGIAGAVVGLVVQATGGAAAALPAQRGHTPARAHAILPRLRADEGVLVLVLRLVIAFQVHTQGTAGGTGRS